jgi:ABC-2 type transport system ATP-binding protein
MLMNLLRPTSGLALMLGGASSQLRGERLEAIGYVSENQKMPDWMSVGEFLRYWRPFYPTWDRALEDRLATRFGLPRKQKLKHLSRGLRMKTSLVSILAYHPKLIVLDEPLSGLDPLVRDELMEGLLGLAGETTVLISSHDLAEIDSFASHVGYMDLGRLRLSEPMASVRERFRSVEIRSEKALVLPENLPAEWLQFSAQGTTAQWIETGFDSSRSLTRVREVFGTVQTKACAMTLREVFLTLAKANRPGETKVGAL